MKLRIGSLIILFIFHSLSVFGFKKIESRNKFRRAQKVN